MSHSLGRLEDDGRIVSESSGIDLIPPTGAEGNPRYAILFFDDVNLSLGATLTVDLGYSIDQFSQGAGSNFWTRPANTYDTSNDPPTVRPIPIRISGGTGSARLLHYGLAEPVRTGTPPGDEESLTNPDPFFHTVPYEEPTYETRLECTPGFAWENGAVPQGMLPIPGAQPKVESAVGFITLVSFGSPIKVSSCSGTLIGSDLFLTARHCLRDPDGRDVRSASVTFDYATAIDGGRPFGETTRFFKVIGEVVAGAPPSGRDSTNDWVVLRLDGAAGGLPVPLNMRDTALMAGETIFTMHHPNGAAKKTQVGTHPGGSLIRGFDFAGGSSGSAVFDIGGNLVRGPLCCGVGCSVTFAELTPIKQALNNPPAPPNPLDVMVVFDKSGSMSSTAPPAGRTKLEEAQDAASLFVQLVREGEGDQIGLLTFNSTASLDRSLDSAATNKSLLAGPPPYASGDIGAITAGGSTSLGAGVNGSILSLVNSSGNDKAILLLSDGLQNTAPMLEEVESGLGSTKVCVVGFGSDGEIDGPLLSRVAREHNGDFTRAVDGLSLKKFFALCFGNIFESGSLSDPDYILKVDQEQSAPHKFNVYDEERITVVLGWDNPADGLSMRLLTPSGVEVQQIPLQRGRTWAFLRVPLPHQGERSGEWQIIIDRSRSVLFAGRNSAPNVSDIRYTFLVIPSGGPKMNYLGGPKRVYTGDPISPLIGLHYPNGSSPDAQVKLTVEGPATALGQLVMDAGLEAPTVGNDSLNAFYATLQKLQSDAGGVLPIPTTTVEVELHDDGHHDDGAMEPDGIYNNLLENSTRYEGTYQFRAVATYGEDYPASREVQWAIHVEPGIDSGQSEVSLLDIRDGDDQRRSATIVLLPRDIYKNPLGPGRGHVFRLVPLPGVTINKPVVDNGDGSYSVDVDWDASIGDFPGVLVEQPDRPSAVICQRVSSKLTNLLIHPGCLLALCLGLIVLILLVILMF
jgi:hypothetical protein